MSEHFDIIGWIGTRPTSQQKRDLIEFLFERYSGLLGKPAEMLLLDTRDDVEEAKVWDPESALIEKTLGPDELLFIYGEPSESSGDCPSLCFAEPKGRANASLTISIPGPSVSANAQTVEGIGKALSAYLTARGFKPLVVGGWEIDFESGGSWSDALRTAVSTSAVEWLAAPADKPVRIVGFERIEIVEGVAFFRKTGTRGH